MEDLNVYMNNGPQNNFEEVKKMNLFQRVIGIIISPSETMKNLIAKPRIVFPIISIALGLLLLCLIFYPQYIEYIKQTMEASLANSKVELSPEQIDAQAKFGAIFGLVGIPFGSVIGWLIGTLIVFGLMKLFKGEGRFIQYMSITGYAYVIILLSYVLMAVVTFVTDKLPMDVAVTSVANLLPTDLKGNFLYGLLKGVEVFAIWKIVVTGIGLKLLSKLNNAKVYAILFGIYIVQLLYVGVNEILTGVILK